MNGPLLNQITQILSASKPPTKILVQALDGQGVVSTIIAAVHTAYPLHKDQDPSQRHPLISLSGSDMASALHAHLAPEEQLNAQGLLASHASLNLIKQVAKTNHGVIHVHCQAPPTDAERVTLQQMLDDHIKDRALDLRKTCIILSGKVEKLSVPPTVKTVTCEAAELPLLTASKVQDRRPPILETPDETRQRIAS